MSIALILWFVVSVICDVAGQLAFKIGADRLPDIKGWPLIRAMVSDPWTLGGVAIYIVEIFVWLRILAEAPLSVAFPIGSLNFLGVTLASHLLLKERVGFRQWLGTVLIMLGVVIVARSA